MGAVFTDGSHFLIDSLYLCIVKLPFDDCSVYKYNTKKIMNKHNTLSIIAGLYMKHLNSAIEKVYGVKVIGGVYSENEELIHTTNK